MTAALTHPILLVTLIILSVLGVEQGARAMRALGENSVPQPARPFQFGLGDILILVTQLALSGALVFRPAAGELQAEILGLCVLWALFVLWWLLGLRALARSGINAGFPRALVLAVLSPLCHGWPLAALFVSPGVIVFGWFIVAAILIAVHGRVMRVLAREIAALENVAAEKRLSFARRAAICLIVPAATWLVTAPVWSSVTFGPPLDLRRFARNMSGAIDVPAVQQWLGSVNIGVLRGGQYGDVAIGTLPPCVSRIKADPNDCTLTEDGHVRINWGGGFGHWGVEIAPKSTAPPPRSSNCVPISDGAWVWRD